MEWRETNSLLIGIDDNANNVYNPVRVASFDLDDTLILRPFKNIHWELLHSSLPKKISDLVSDRYVIVVFSNQSGMSNSKFDIGTWKKSFTEFYQKMFSGVKNYYFALYVSKTHDLNRKPNIGMWIQMQRDLKEHFGSDIRISKKSFYCGDAAGRTENSTFQKKFYPKSKVIGDFADTDRKFALNIGIDFYTPEEFFLGEKPEENWSLSGFDPDNLETVLYLSKPLYFKSREKELILTIGAPGSGKSEYVEKYIKPKGYVVVNRDTCRTKQRCLEKVKDALDRGKNVIVDNTNPDPETRAEYINLALDRNYKHIRAIVFDTNLKLAKHLNNVRHVYSKGIIPKVHPIAYNVYNKKYVQPSKNEGFDKIEYSKLDFDFDKLKNLRWKKIFHRYSD